MAEVKPLPPIDRLKALLDYDPDTGVLTWTDAAPRNRGKVAGNPNKQGRRVVGVEGRCLKVARVCYALATGADPCPLTIDHINRDPGDNRLANLRPATPAQQTANRGLMKGQRAVRVTYPDGRSEVCASQAAAARVLKRNRDAIRGALARPTGAMMTRGPGGWVPNGITLCEEM